MNKLIPIFVTAVLSFAAGLVLQTWLHKAGASLSVQQRVPRPEPRSDDSTQAAALSLDDTFHQTLSAPAPTPTHPQTHTLPSPSHWPQFRGPGADNVRRGGPALIDDLSDIETRVRWRLKLGEGHAGAAVRDGRVYILDYDEDRRADVLRCFNFHDGTEFWRTGYPVSMKRNHGYSRTVPTVTDDVVVTIGPRCHVLACDTETGRPLWTRDLVAEFATDEPLWYTAQCPLVDGDTVVLAPAGESVLMAGVSLRTGETKWTAPNPQGWRMSHSSVILATFHDTRQYIYAAMGGVVAVSAEPDSEGTVLWSTGAWNNRVVAPCPVALDSNRLLLTSGHGAGGRILRLERSGDQWSAHEDQRFAPSELASEQQTPILWNNRLFTVLPKDGGAHRTELVSATTEGEIGWTSGDEHRFGLGPYVLADKKIFIINDNGRLSVYDMTKPTTPEFRDSTEILPGPEAWGPIAVAHGHLIARDNQRMVCIDLRKNP